MNRCWFRGACRVCLAETAPESTQLMKLSLAAAAPGYRAELHQTPLPLTHKLPKLMSEKLSVILFNFQNGGFQLEFLGFQVI